MNLTFPRFLQHIPQRARDRTWPLPVRFPKDCFSLRNGPVVCGCLCPPRLLQPHSRRVVAERANRSLHQLSCILREDNAAGRDDALEPSFSTEEGNEDPGTAWHQLQHSHAGDLNAALIRVTHTHSEFFELHTVTTPTPLPSLLLGFYPCTTNQLI